MADWFDGVDVFLEWAPDDAPLTPTASCTWVDITGYMRAFSTNRGRTSELSTYSPGTATVVLDNLTRLFDVSNTAGTYYGKLLPLKRIRIRAVAGATSAVIFAGYVTGWPVSYPGMVDSTVTVQCVDALRICEQSPLPGSAYEAEVLSDFPDYYWPMQDVDETGGTPAAVSGYDLGSVGPFADAFEVATGFAPVGATRAVTTGTQLAITPGAANQLTLEYWWTKLAEPDPAGDPITNSVRFVVDSTNYLIVSQNETAEVGVPTLRRFGLFYSNSTANRYGTASIGSAPTIAFPESFAVGTSHHIAVTVGLTNALLYVDGQLYFTLPLSVGTSAGVFAGGTTPGAWADSQANGVSHVATYPSALSAAQILAHYEAGYISHGHPTGERSGARVGRILDAIAWPTADRDLSTGETVLGQWSPGGASALTEMRNVGDTESGLLFAASDGDITLRDRQWQMTNTRAVTAQATFGDSGAEIGYTDPVFDGNHIDWVRNVVSVNGGPAGTRTVKDAASITAYGQQSDNVSATELPAWGAWLARQFGNFRLRARKDPATRVSAITAQARGDNAAATITRLGAVLPLELGDRVVVKRRPTGGAGSFSLQCAVQGIAHTCTPGDWTVQMYLAPAPKSYTEGPYLTVADATYGRIGAAAGNLVPY